MCSDVNECLMAPSPCSPNANCSNTEGSFKCHCLDGYYGNGSTCQSERKLLQMFREHLSCSCAFRTIISILLSCFVDFLSMNR